MYSTHLERLQSVVIAGLAMALSSCASSRFQTVRGGPQLSPTFDLAGRNHSAGATVNTVIVRGGPGSWKHDAWWDEYVVSLTNHGSTPLLIESAELVCTTGKRSLPGDDPWFLEDQSRTLWSGLQTSQAVYSSVLIGTGGFLVECVTFGEIDGLGWAWLAIDRTLAVDNRNAASIAAEFERRRLRFPLRIVPGQTRTGSLFFPVTPGPSVLNVSCRTVQRQWQIAINLAPLANLHRGGGRASEPDPMGVPLAPLGTVAGTR